LADQSQKHPFAQLNYLSLNIYFNSHWFHDHFPLSFSGTFSGTTQQQQRWMMHAPVEGAGAADDLLSLMSMMPELPDPAPLSPHPFHPKSV
jgi:hypothetical protein